VCGIAGVFQLENAQSLVQRILFAIQHRGQESCGIAARGQDGAVHAYRGMGLVKNVLTPELLAQYQGDIAIGHVRYPTAGSSNLLNAQPHAIDLAEGPHIAICSNGDIINYGEVRSRLERENGFTFKSDNDAELIGRLIAFYHVIHKQPVEEAIRKTQHELKGAFSTLLMYRDKLYAFRDPHGLRPFVMGHVDYQGVGRVPSEGTVFSSESCGFGIVGAQMLREVEPGEILRLEPGAPIETVSRGEKERRHCVFELIYFSRPDSLCFGEMVYDVRNKIGAALAAKDTDLPIDDDLVVIPVPDSSNFVAHGYARARGLHYDMGLLRNHYVGRTFIQPSQKMRDEGVKQKFNPLPGYFPGKRVVLVDDSIVRGTSLRKIVRMIKSAGAKEVHVRIGSPPVIGPCYYGIDTPTAEELVANRMSIPEIAEFLSADSLRYMDIEDFEPILKFADSFCFACFNKNYIYPPQDYGHQLNVPDQQRC
jgi:amidophosphoribosyltransferase